MKDLNKLMVEISKLTLDIESNYPELYTFLNETPITIPSDAHPEIDEAILRDYLDSLKELLKRHIQHHKRPPNFVITKY